MTVADALRTLSQSHREILVAPYFRGRTVAGGGRGVLGPAAGHRQVAGYYALRALRTAHRERG